LAETGSESDSERQIQRDRFRETDSQRHRQIQSSHEAEGEEIVKDGNGMGVSAEMCVRNCSTKLTRHIVFAATQRESRGLHRTGGRGGAGSPCR